MAGYLRHETGLHCRGWRMSPLSLPPSKPEGIKYHWLSLQNPPSLLPSCKEKLPCLSLDSGSHCSMRSSSHTTPGDPWSWSYRPHGFPPQLAKSDVSVRTDKTPVPLLICTSTVLNCAPTPSIFLFLVFALSSAKHKQGPPFLLPGAPLWKLLSILASNSTILSSRFPHLFLKVRICCGVSHKAFCLA